MANGLQVHTLEHEETRRLYCYHPSSKASWSRTPFWTQSALVFSCVYAGKVVHCMSVIFVVNARRQQINSM